MRRLAIFSASFAFAAAAYIWLLPDGWRWPVTAALVLVAAAGFFFSSDPARRIRIAAMGGAAALLWTGFYERTNILPIKTLAGEDRAITVEICDFPQTTDYGCQVLTKTEKGKILLFLDCPPEQLSYGDSLSLTADLIDVTAAGEENNLYYQSRDIDLIGIQRGELRRSPAEKLPLRAWPAVALRALRSSITEIFPEDTAGFATALLTGDKSGLSFSVQNELSITGISHIMAVSGMHVSLLSAMVLRLFRNRRRTGAVVCLLVLLFFAAMLGFTPSVTRAVIMNSILLFAPLLQRENDLLTSLSFALLIILAINPWAIANVSLQLSFSAMVGIYLLTPWVFGRLAGALKVKEPEEDSTLRNRILRYGTRITATSAGAAAATTPIAAYSFQTVSIIAPVTNLLALPIVSGIFSASFVTAVVGIFYAPLGSAMAWLIAWPMRLILFLAQSLAKIPYAAVYTQSFYVSAWLVTAYVLIGVYCLLRKSCRLRMLFCALAITLVAAVFFSQQQTGVLCLTAMDVGQGQCVVLQSGGQTALIDCGGDAGDSNGETLARQLLMAGESRVDAVVLTHFDEDHMCGLCQLMKRLDVVRIYVPDVQRGDVNRALVLQAAQEEGAEVIFVTMESVLPLGSGTIRLYPPTDPEEDNASLSALLSFREYDILITGDMSSHQERALLEAYQIPQVELLFAGHHGSKYSTCAELLEATRPETVIISVGENDYGHPTAEVLERIFAVGAQVYRTDLHGSITVTR